VSGWGGFAVEDDLDAVGSIAVWEDGFDLFENTGGEIDVERGAGGFVVKVGVRVEIGAVAGGTTLEVDLADEVALDEGFEAVVNRGEGGSRKLGFDAGVNFVGRGVIAFGEEGAINNFTLRGGAQAAVSECLREGFGRVGGGRGHGESKVKGRDWNASKSQAGIGITLRYWQISSRDKFT